MLKGEGKKGIKAKKGTNNHIYLVVYLKDRLVNLFKITQKFTGSEHFKTVE